MSQFELVYEKYKSREGRLGRSDERDIRTYYEKSDLYEKRFSNWDY